MASPDQPTASDPNVPSTPAPRKRRKWPWVLLILVVLLILLVLMAPMIASTGPVRSIVVGKINDQLNGKLAVNDWSIGWTSGVTLNGVKIDDEKGRRVLEVNQIRVPASLIGLAKGDLNLGEVVIDRPNLVNVEVYPDGTTNLERLVKQQAGDVKKKEPAKEESDKLPDIKGKFIIKELRGSITAPETPKVQIDPSDITVNIVDLNNAPIENDVKLKYRVGQSPQGTITAAGKVSLNDMSADQSVKIDSADLSAASPFLKKQQMTLAGVANGALAVKVQGGSDGSVEGEFRITNFAVGGEALKGDTYKSSVVSIPISVATTAAGNDTKITIKTLKVETDQVLVDVSGQASQSALTNLAAQKAPGSDGQLAVAVSTKDLPGLVNQLRNTTGLQKEVEIKSGEFKTRIDIAMTSDKATLKQALDLQVAGTNAGKPVSLDPVHLDTSLAIPDLRDIAINMKSAFATIDGGGPSIANLNVKGNADLAKLRQQLAQFIDLGDLDLSGNANFEVASKGDLTKPGGVADIAAKVNLDNLAVDAKANVVRGQTDFVEKIPSATVNFSSPNLAALQKQLGAIIDLPVQATSGSVSGVVSGAMEGKKLTFDTKTKLANVSLNQIDATTKQPKPLIQNESQDIVAVGVLDLPATENDPMNATLSALSVTSTNNLIAINKVGAAPLIVKVKGKAIGGSGELKIASDLKRLNDTLQAMGEKPAVATSAGQLQSGLLDATVKLEATPEAGTNINLAGAINNLTVTTNQQPIQNEKVTIALAANTPADFSGVNVTSANIDSSFAKTTVTGAQIVLKLPNGATPSTFDMIKSAKVQIAIPDIAKTMAVAEAFAPPAPTTMPALVIGGGAAVNLEIARDANNTTQIKSANIAASKVSLVRGQRRFDFPQPINVNLAADVGTSGDQIQQLRLTQLTGDLGGLAKIDMPAAITVTNLSSAVPNANGKIALTGDIEPLTRMLAVVQDADPMPYAGKYDLNQTVTTDSNRLKLAGQINVNQFVVIQNGKPAFTEDKLVIDNDLAADTNTKTATVNNLNLRMLSSNAAGVAVKGTITDWETQRKLDGVTCDLSYDLAKVWQILKPMMTAEQQKSYEDLKVAGVAKRTFTLAGSYPANVPYQQAIKLLSADGAIAFSQFYTSGIDIRDYELPITLRDGQLTTKYANKPKGEQVPKPAVCNGTGALDIGSILLDLTGPEPLLSIGKNQKLLSEVPLNPVLADSLGKFAAFLFKDSKEASGLVNVTVVECDKVPLGEMLKGQNSGKARVNVEIKNLRLDGPVSRAIAAVAQLGSEGIVGEVKDSSITYANGQTNSDIAIFLTRKGVQVPLRFSGGIGLKNLDLRNTVLNIPPQLLGSDEITRAFPQGIQLPVTGTVTNYKWADAGEIVKKNLGGVVGGILGQLGGDKREAAPANPANPANPPKPSGDPIGDVIDLFGNKKKKDEPKMAEPKPAEPKPAEPKPAEPKAAPAATPPAAQPAPPAPPPAKKKKATPAPAPPPPPASQPAPPPAKKKKK